MDGNQLRQRSIENRLKAFVRFFNKTERTVELIWINYSGEYKKYRILLKDEYVDINTFKTHPWFALDHQTKEKLYIDNYFVYQPKTSREILQERRPDVQVSENYELRVKSYITLPLQSLKDKALTEIGKCLQGPIEVDLLNIPQSLANELKTVISNRNYLSEIAFIS